MKQVLLADEKHGFRVFDASTEGLHHEALVKLFRERENQGWYNDLAIMESEVYKRAKTGDFEALRRLFSQRDEYERVYVQEVEE